jgi:arginyl-tRNA synthetase
MTMIEEGAALAKQGTASGIQEAIRSAGRTIDLLGSMADKYNHHAADPWRAKRSRTWTSPRRSPSLQYTDPDIQDRDRVVKKSEKESLYAAMDVAAIWLERALSQR